MTPWVGLGRRGGWDDPFEPGPLFFAASVLAAGLLVAFGATVYSVASTVVAAAVAVYAADVASRAERDGKQLIEKADAIHLAADATLDKAAELEAKLQPLAAILGRSVLMSRAERLNRAFETLGHVMGASATDLSASLSFFAAVAACTNDMDLPMCEQVMEAVNARELGKPGALPDGALAALCQRASTQELRPMMEQLRNTIREETAKANEAARARRAADAAKSATP